MLPLQFCGQTLLQKRRKPRVRVCVRVPSAVLELVLAAAFMLLNIARG